MAYDTGEMELIGELSIFVKGNWNLNAWLDSLNFIGNEISVKVLTQSNDKISCALWRFVCTGVSVNKLCLRKDVTDALK